MYLMIQFTYYDQWLLVLNKTYQSCLLHFLLEQIARVVFVLEDVSCHGLWNIRDAAEEICLLPSTQNMLAWVRRCFCLFFVVTNFLS